MIVEIAQALSQFGVAGLMGALWVWERSMSRKRETQLSAAHEQLKNDRVQLRELMRLVHRNTRAVERFEQTQSQLRELLERIYGEQNQRAA